MFFHLCALSQVSDSANESVFPTTFKVDGETKSRDDLKDLFHSLKFNVRPPHFLITKDKIQSGLANTTTSFFDLLVEALDLGNGLRGERAEIQANIRRLDEHLSVYYGHHIAFWEAELRKFKDWRKQNLVLERLRKFMIAEEYQKAVQEESKAAQEHYLIRQEFERLKYVKINA